MIRAVEFVFNTHALRWEIAIAVWVFAMFCAVRLCSLNSRRSEYERRALAKELERGE